MSAITPALAAEYAGGPCQVVTELSDHVDQTFPIADLRALAHERAGRRLVAIDNAKEILALVDRGMTPAQAIRAATVVSPLLIVRDDELGRVAPGYLAHIIAVPGDPTTDITRLTDIRLVMKDGVIHKRP